MPGTVHQVTGGYIVDVGTYTSGTLCYFVVTYVKLLSTDSKQCNIVN